MAFGTRCEILKNVCLLWLEAKSDRYVGLHYVYADVYNSSSNTVDRITTHVISPIDRIICYMSNNNWFF